MVAIHYDPLRVLKVTGWHCIGACWDSCHPLRPAEGTESKKAVGEGFCAVVAIHYDPLRVLKGALSMRGGAVGALPSTTTR